MPKTVFDKKPTINRLARLLIGAIGAEGKTQSEIGDIIGCTRQTVAAKLANPETLEVWQLLKIGKATNTPIEDLRAAIHY